jgi:hypothetical protein
LECSANTTLPGKATSAIQPPTTRGVVSRLTGIETPFSSNGVAEMFYIAV